MQAFLFSTPATPALNLSSLTAAFVSTSVDNSPPCTGATLVGVTIGVALMKTGVSTPLAPFTPLVYEPAVQLPTITAASAGGGNSLYNIVALSAAQLGVLSTYALVASTNYAIVFYNASTPCVEVVGAISTTPSSAVYTGGLLVVPTASGAYARSETAASTTFVGQPRMLANGPNPYYFGSSLASVDKVLLASVGASVS